MNKLRLDADALRVESFPTAPAALEAGTVHANAGTLVGGSCPQATCHTYDDTLCGLTRGCE
jgi:hypothetical protein